MFCNNCGKEIEEGAKFCRFCGHDLTTDDYQKKNISTKTNSRKFKWFKDYLTAFVIAGAVILIAIIVRFSFFDLDYEYRKGNYENIVREYDASSIEEYDKEKKLKIINSYVKMGREDEVRDEINQMFDGINPLDLNTALEAKLYIIYLKNKVKDFDFREPFLFISNEVKNSKVAEVLRDGKDEITNALESVDPKEIIEYFRNNAKKFDLKKFSEDLKENFKNNQFVNDFTETIDMFFDSASKYGKEGAEEIANLISEEIYKTKNKANISWNYIKNEYKNNLSNLNQFFASDKVKNIEKFLGKDKFAEIFKKSVAKSKDKLKSEGEKLTEAFDISKEVVFNFLEEVKNYLENTSVYKYLKDTTSNIIDIFKDNKNIKSNR